VTRFSLLFAAALAALALLLSGAAEARQHEPAPSGAERPAEEAAEPGTEHAEAEHVPGDINWFYGWIAEKEGAEPGLLFRPKGMQPPLGGVVVNTVILFWLLVRFTRRPVADALKKRKGSIMQGMEDAARMKKDAAERLGDYEAKLDHIDQEIERVKREMREAGETERVRILAEAKERRGRMERDAQLLIEQEIKAARQIILRETVQSAVKSASERLQREVSAADHQRLADEYLAGLDRAFTTTKGGQT
jgi:F-type H+-transporting ATPase subunit b